MFKVGGIFDKLELFSRRIVNGVKCHQPSHKCSHVNGCLAIQILFIDIVVGDLNQHVQHILVSVESRICYAPHRSRCNTTGGPQVIGARR